VAYKTQGHEAFQDMMAGVQHDIVHTIYHVGIVKQEKPKEREKAPVASIWDEMTLPLRQRQEIQKVLREINP